MTPFSFATAGRVVFGRGVSAQLGAHAKALGARVLWCTGRDADRHAALRALVLAQGLTIAASLRTPTEPTLEEAEAGALLAREASCDLVIAVGGGAALDLGKAVAALAVNPGPALRYLEVVGAGEALPGPSLPLIAVPTTSGTGAEVTRNAVLACPTPDGLGGRHGRIKVSLRADTLLPRVALVDPALTDGLPAALTASTGLDALTQVIEPFLSCRANPLTDALCREAIPRAAWALPRAYLDPLDREARDALSLVSLLGGLALANAGLGVAHGFAGPLGGLFGAPHGVLCARLLPASLRVNLRAATERAPALLPRFTELARLLTGQPHAKAEDAPRFLAELAASLGIRRLSTLGLTPADGPLAVQAAAQASSTKGNPLPLTEDELTAILAEAL